MNRMIMLLGFIAFHIMGFAQQKANYELAERMRKITQTPIAKNTLIIRPNFIKGSDCFYYSFQTEEGKNTIGWIRNGKRRNCCSIMPN